MLCQLNSPALNKFLLFYAIPDIRDQLEDPQGLVEGELERWLVDDGSEVMKAMRYSALGGGKRIRASLCLLSCELGLGSLEKAMPAAAALECLHAYSLIHDDLPCMDDDDLRRGKPSNHKTFGEAMAVLAGDGLQAMAFQILAEGYEKDPSLSHALTRLMAEAVGPSGMVGGQGLDMSDSTPRTEEQLEGLHRKKTGALLRASVLMGARCGGLQSESDRWQQLDRFSQALGLAFQVSDDLLDATASTEALGKTAGKDAEQDKLTFVSLLGLEGARAKAQQLLDDMQNALNGFGEEADPLRALAQYVVDRQH